MKPKYTTINFVISSFKNNFPFHNFHFLNSEFLNFHSPNSQFCNFHLLKWKVKVWWRQVVTTPDPSPEARNVSSNLFLSHPTSLHQNIKVTIGTINGRHYHYPKKENVWVQQTSFCLQQVIGVDQEKWTGIKNFVRCGKPANGNYVWTTT